MRIRRMHPLFLQVVGPCCCACRLLSAHLWHLVRLSPVEKLNERIRNSGWFEGHRHCGLDNARWSHYTSCSSSSSTASSLAARGIGQDRERLPSSSSGPVFSSGNGEDVWAGGLDENRPAAALEHVARAEAKALSPRRGPSRPCRRRPALPGGAQGSAKRP